MMMKILIACLGLFIGFAAGRFWASLEYGLFKWKTFIWSADLFAWRQINESQIIKPGDRLIYGFELNLTDIPNAGVKISSLLDGNKKDSGES